jgi:class 3 adenylate cyclase
VKFLFAEVEDSTGRSEGAAADMAAAFQVHDAMVRDAIESQSGYVFATDGSAVFSTATDAATAAVAAQRLLAEAAIPFGVRMGLHTGEAVEREGKYFGTDVNRAARLTSLAHGGQVVVSDTAEVLLRQRTTSSTCTRRHVYTKIGVSGRAAATRWAVKHNVVDAAGR